MQMGSHSLPCPPLTGEEAVSALSVSVDQGHCRAHGRRRLQGQVAGVSGPSFSAGNYVKSGALIVETLRVPGVVSPDLDLPGSHD